MQSSTKVKSSMPRATSSEVVVYSSQPKKKKKSRRNRRRRNNKVSIPRGLTTHTFAQEYARCLNNPFDCEPPRLGLGTMIPTTMASAYGRYTVTSSPNGTFAVVLNPYLVRCSASTVYGSFFSGNVTDTTVDATWNVQGTASDYSGMLADYDRLRLITAGMRVYPLAAPTATPGTTYSGIIPPIALNSSQGTNNSVVPGGTSSLWMTGANGLKPDSWIQSPSFEMSLNPSPIQVKWRPSELSDFDFTGMNQTGTARSVEEQGPVLMCVGVGFPAAAVIRIDCIAHYEGYVSAANTPAASLGYESKQSTVESSRPPSVDSLWGQAIKFLEPAVDLALTGVGGLLTSAIGNIVPWASGLLKTPPMFHGSVLYPGKIDKLVRNSVDGVVKPGFRHFVSEEKHDVEPLLSPHVVQQHVSTLEDDDDHHIVPEADISEARDKVSSLVRSASSGTLARLANQFRPRPSQEH